jgi:putative ABC transport system ATP-binding protein/lipoprotein-releasing system ATP-binding protein
MLDQSTIESQDGALLVRGRDASKDLGVAAALRTVVEPANFDIFAGNRISLAGQSGSGKSTLLHLIAGLSTPTSGVVEWPQFGSIDELRPTFIGIAFQGPSLLAPLTVIENVALPLLLLGESESDARSAALEMLDRFELGEVADKLPEEISGGQSQRVGVARSLMGEPRLIVADEPTGQCDQVTAFRVLDIIDELTRERGCALIIASHDPRIASRMDIHWTIESGRLARNLT